MAAFEVGDVYRNLDLIDNCNRGRISRPGLDFSPPTGRIRQSVGGKGSFPRDCSEIALRLQVWPGCPGAGAVQRLARFVELRRAGASADAEAAGGGQSLAGVGLLPTA